MAKMFFETGSSFYSLSTRAVFFYFMGGVNKLNKQKLIYNIQHQISKTLSISIGLKNPVSVGLYLGALIWMNMEFKYDTEVNYNKH